MEVECINYYSKGAGYEIDQKMNKLSHEYNIVKLDNKWYPIDSTWGAGYANGVNFNKELKEEYFLLNQELLITSHFPKDDKWQLTKEKYTLEEFEYWAIVKFKFFEYGFKSFEPREELIKLNNCNRQKFIFYGDNMNHKSASCKINLLYKNHIVIQNNIDNICYYNDRFEMDCIFNKKGEYKIEIFGSSKKGKDKKYILEYKFIVENDADEQLSFP